MIYVNVNKGYDLNISGKPSPELKKLKKPSQVALLPERIPFVKPRLKVKIGDSVKVGSILFEDKANTSLTFLSPGGGKVKEINFGPRRVIQEIVIELEKEEQYIDFQKVTASEIRSLDQDALVEIFMQGGVWPLIRELPFRGIANPDSRPSSIWVALGGKGPFQPIPEVYLKGREELFSFGLTILKQFGFTVNVSAPDDFHMEGYDSMVTHRVAGKYPAHDPGVVLYQTKKSAAENISWYVSGQDLLAIAQLLKNGKYPVERVVVTGGSRVKNRRHLQTRLGVSVLDLIPEITPGEICISGGLLTGYEVKAGSYLGLYETSLTFITQGDQSELFGFFRPGFKKPSFSRTFLSVFQKQPFDMDNGMHGETRACVNCGSCTKICPVDILPQYTIKCLVADAIEEALAHGLLDCVECGLCSYVCPSKIELREILQKAKHEYYIEQR